MDYQIKIFKNIHDAELKEAWIRLQYENDVFPQMYYEWIEPWVNLRLGKRTLKIVTVTLDNTIIAIAPFCIENTYGLKVLRTLPIHFGDFYYIIGNIDFSIISPIINYLKINKSYHAINLQNINTDSVFYSKLIESKVFKKKKTSDIVNTSCKNDSIENLLTSLSKNQRKSLKRRIKRINELGGLRLDAIHNEKQYDDYENEMKHIFYKRWAKEQTKETEQVFEYRQKSFTNCLNNKKAQGFVLLLDEKPIAYCLGFYFSDEFRSWKLVYDDEYFSFSPGIIITAEILVYLNKKNIKYYNHGNGFYNYKLEWFESQVLSANYQFLFSNTILGKCYLAFELKLKDRLKKIWN